MQVTIHFRRLCIKMWPANAGLSRDVLTISATLFRMKIPNTVYYFLLHIPSSFFLYISPSNILFQPGVPQNQNNSLKLRWYISNNKPLSRLQECISYMLQKMPPFLHFLHIPTLVPFQWKLLNSFEVCWTLIVSSAQLEFQVSSI